MNKIKYVFKLINELQIKTSKKKIAILFDMLLCKIKYQANITDYEIFEMYKLNSFERKTIITKGKNNELIKKYNIPKFFKYFNNKIKFNKTFNKYLNYDWLELNRNLEEFKEFCKKVKKVTAKTENDKKLLKNIDTEKENIEGLYNKCIEEGKYLIEEALTITPSLEKYGENTPIIKVITLLGEVIAAYFYIEGEVEKSETFNGLIAPIDIETGIINYPAVDNKNKEYLTFAETGKKIKDLNIPSWDKVKNLCETASLEVPAVGYVCWDIAIGKNKCYLLSGTGTPNHYFYGLPSHRENNVGLLPLFKKIEERKIEK